MGLETLLLAGGMGMQAGGAIGGGIAAKRAAESNARLADMRGDIARRNAELESLQVADQAARVVSTATAQNAASGFAVGQGSPLLSVLATLTAAEKDQGMIRRRAGLSKWEAELEARSQRFAGRQAMLSGVVGAAGALVKGAGGLYKSIKPGMGSDTFNPLFGEPR